MLTALERTAYAIDKTQREARPRDAPTEELHAYLDAAIRNLAGKPRAVAEAAKAIIEDM